jgi:hypothetical protein
LWFVLPINQIPWVPWTVRIRIGTPIAPEELFADDAEGSLDAAYERVHAAVENLVNPKERGRA